MVKCLGLILILLCGCLSCMGGATLPAEDAYQQGMDAYQKQDYKTALRAWRPLAEQGNAAAQVALGELYYPKLDDWEEAARWNLKAAEQGDVRGQVALADQYRAMASKFKDSMEPEPTKKPVSLFAWSLHKDGAQAVRWYRKAAEQGYTRPRDLGTPASYIVANKYAEGRGVP